MRLATISDLPLISSHVIQSYLSLFKDEPQEYYHQVCGLTTSFPHLFIDTKFKESIHVVFFQNDKLIATAGVVPSTPYEVGKSTSLTNTAEQDVSWKLVSVYVDDNFRKMGIATRMINVLIDILRSKNVDKLTLFTLPNHMPNAAQLYKKMGFKMTQRILPKQFKDGTPRNMVYETHEMDI